MKFTEVFKRLNGREASAEDVLRFERLTTALETTPGDAMLAVLVALDHYRILYSAIPTQITDTATDILDAFKRSADAQAMASMAAAKTDMAKAVSQVAVKVANNTSRKQMWRWATGCIAVAFVALALFGWYLHQTGLVSGYSTGYGEGYREAKDEKAAAAWANTPEGQMAYKFAQTGELQRLARCQGEGWTINNGACYPYTAKNKLQHGWNLPK